MGGNDTNVLIISDRDDITESINQLLAAEGFNVYTANNGNSGVNIARKVPVHLLITGMVMPGMFGNEIIKEIKSIDENTTQPEKEKAKPRKPGRAVLPAHLKRVEKIYLITHKAQPCLNSVVA